MRPAVLVKARPPPIRRYIRAERLGKRNFEHLLLHCWRRHRDLLWKVETCNAAERYDDVLQTERVDRPDIEIVAFLDTEDIKAAPQFCGAFRVIRDACHAARRAH